MHAWLSLQETFPNSMLIYTFLVHFTDSLDAPIRPADIAKIAGNLPQPMVVAGLLKIPQEEINDIEGLYHVVAQQREAVLRKWINKIGTAATYRVLYDTLITLDERGSAEKISSICSD